MIDKKIGVGDKDELYVYELAEIRNKEDVTVSSDELEMINLIGDREIIIEK
jgi:hypothetical protein